MTVEEKAQAYDEAIKRAKAEMMMVGADCETIKRILPELRESEDERVRMALCDIVREMPYMETELRAHGLTVEKALVYLEKVKDTKSDKEDSTKFKLKEGIWYVCVDNFYHNDKLLFEKGDIFRATKEMVEKIDEATAGKCFRTIFFPYSTVEFFCKDITSTSLMEDGIGWSEDDEKKLKFVDEYLSKVVNRKWFKDVYTWLNEDIPRRITLSKKLAEDKK